MEALRKQIRQMRHLVLASFLCLALGGGVAIWGFFSNKESITTIVEDDIEECFSRNQTRAKSRVILNRLNTNTDDPIERAFTAGLIAEAYVPLDCSGDQP